MASNITTCFPVCVLIFPYTAGIEALFFKQVNISVEATFRFGVGSLKEATVWVWVHRCGTTCFDCLSYVKIFNVYCHIQVCSGFENTFNLLPIYIDTVDVFNLCMGDAIRKWLPYAMLSFKGRNPVQFWFIWYHKISNNAFQRFFVKRNCQLTFIPRPEKYWRLKEVFITVWISISLRCVFCPGVVPLTQWTFILWIKFYSYLE